MNNQYTLVLIPMYILTYYLISLIEISINYLIEVNFFRKFVKNLRFW